MKKENRNTSFLATHKKPLIIIGAILLVLIVGAAVLLPHQGEIRELMRQALNAE